MDVSGTAEEIHRANAAGKPVHIYFSAGLLPRDADLAQVAALRNCKEELEQAGLLGEYGDPIDLAGQVEYAVQQDITDQGWAAHVASTSRSGAMLRWRHHHEKEFKGSDRNGKAQCRTTANQLVVSNDSDAVAENLTFQVEPADGGEATFHHFDGPEGPITLHPRSEMQWLLIPLGIGTLQIDAQWTEGGIPRAGCWTVAIR